VIQSSFLLNNWSWDKATGDNERTGKVKEPIKDTFVSLMKSLIKFSKHTTPLQLFNRNRLMNVYSLRDPTIGGQNGVGYTDFSSQLDLEPVRKVRRLLFPFLKLVL